MNANVTEEINTRVVSLSVRRTKYALIWVTEITNAKKKVCIILLSACGTFNYISVFF